MPSKLREWLQERSKADAAPDYKDWSRICYELLNTLESLTALQEFLTSTIVRLEAKIGNNIYSFDVPNIAGNYDMVLATKTRIIQVIVLKASDQSNPNDTITVKNGNISISDEIRITQGLSSSIDTKNNTILAGGTLRVTAAKKTNCACQVYVLGVKVP